MNVVVSSAITNRAFLPPKRTPAWSVSEVAGRARVLSLEPGLHALTVAPISTAAPVSGLALPATCISGSGEIEIMAPDGPARDWVGAEGGLALVKVRKRPGEIVITTYGVGDSAAAPAIAVQRLAPPEAPPVEPEPDVPEEPGLAAAILLHIARLGDQTFQTGYWAGDPGGRLPIEGLAITPAERLLADDVEYMAVAVNGARTPWVSGSRLAGLRGHGIALAGFAARPAPAMADRFDVIYEGAYLSGERAGPRRNGEPCLPPRPGLALTALRIRIVPRPGMLEPDPAPPSEAAIEPPIPIAEAQEPGPETSPPPADVPAPAEEATPPVDPAAAQLRYEIDLIREHLDPVHYLATLNDSPSKAEVRDIGLVEHFCTFGWREGRDPCGWFSVEQYLAAHPDVVEAGWNPLVHYLSYGKEENRSVFPASPPRSPDREALAAMSNELATVRGELAAARKVGQALMTALREDNGSPPPPIDLPKPRRSWLRFWRRRS